MLSWVRIPPQGPTSEPVSRPRIFFTHRRVDHVKTGSCLFVRPLARWLWVWQPEPDKKGGWGERKGGFPLLCHGALHDAVLPPSPTTPQTRLIHPCGRRCIVGKGREMGTSPVSWTNSTTGRGEIRLPHAPGGLPGLWTRNRKLYNHSRQVPHHERLTTYLLVSRR